MLVSLSPSLPSLSCHLSLSAPSLSPPACLLPLSISIFIFSVHVSPILAYTQANSFHMSTNMVLSTCVFKSRGTFSSMPIREGYQLPLSKACVHPWASHGNCEEEYLLTELDLLHPPSKPVSHPWAHHRDGMDMT